VPAKRPATELLSRENPFWTNDLKEIPRVFREVSSGFGRSALSDRPVAVVSGRKIKILLANQIKKGDYVRN
jgi:hypothetical protein